MQSYTTQSHQRNYQGKVVLPTQGHVTATQPKRHKTLGKIATSALALAVVATGGVLGATTLHSQPTHRQVWAAAQIEDYHTTDYNATERAADNQRYENYYQTERRENQTTDDDTRQQRYDTRRADNRFDQAHESSRFDRDDRARDTRDNRTDRDEPNVNRETRDNRDRSDNRIKRTERTRDNYAERDTNDDNRDSHVMRSHERHLPHAISDREHETGSMPGLNHPTHERHDYHDESRNNFAR